MSFECSLVANCRCMAWFYLYLVMRFLSRVTPLRDEAEESPLRTDLFDSLISCRRRWCWY